MMSYAAVEVNVTAGPPTHSSRPGAPPNQGHSTLTSCPAELPAVPLADTADTPPRVADRLDRAATGPPIPWAQRQHDWETARMAEQADALDVPVAVAGLYDVFALYRLGEVVEGCSHCVAVGDERALHRAPLRRLDGRSLGRYAFKALTTWGDVDDLRHFLPRLLELAAANDPDLPGLEVLFGKLTLGRLAHVASRRAGCAGALFHRAVAADAGALPGRTAARDAAVRARAGHRGPHALPRHLGRLAGAPGSAASRRFHRRRRRPLDARTAWGSPGQRVLGARFRPGQPGPGLALAPSHRRTAGRRRCRRGQRVGDPRRGKRTPRPDGNSPEATRLSSRSAAVRIHRPPTHPPNSPANCATLHSSSRYRACTYASLRLYGCASISARAGRQHRHRLRPERRRAVHHRRRRGQGLGDLLPRPGRRGRLLRQGADRLGRPAAPRRRPPVTGLEQSRGGLASGTAPPRPVNAGLGAGQHRSYRYRPTRPAGSCPSTFRVAPWSWNSSASVAPSGPMPSARPSQAAASARGNRPNSIWARHRPGRTTAGCSRDSCSLVVIATSRSRSWPSSPSVRLSN